LPIILLLAAEACWITPDIRRNLECWLENSDDAYTKKEGFRVDGTLNQLTVNRVDDGSKEAEATVSMSYEFFTPHIRWKPYLVYNGISDIDLDISQLHPPMIDGCSK
ncbi:hypothetical protein PENTCL1PPCAC_21583, partial [Pristionchus entomophagus]